MEKHCENWTLNKIRILLKKRVKLKKQEKYLNVNFIPLGKFINKLRMKLLTSAHVIKTICLFISEYYKWYILSNTFGSYHQSYRGENLPVKKTLNKNKNDIKTNDFYGNLANITAQQARYAKALYCHET